jgi:cyclopropane-fatty-acyl-phospholipid synthase
MTELVEPTPIRTPRLTRRLALAATRAWRDGCLTLRFADGEVARLGDPAAADRAEVTIDDDAALARMLLRGDVGVGEAYVAGQWRADDLPMALRLALRNRRALPLDGRLARLGQLAGLVRHRLRRNDRRGAARHVHAHYDLGNDLYRLFLDETMAYSCGIFESPADTLETAQRRKYDRICAALRLGPRDHLLDLGCGWGGLAIHAARTRGCRVTGVTISPAQHAEARARVRAAGLADRVAIELVDYRDLRGRFDRIVSVEMIEQVGHDFLPGYFAACARLLAPDGVMLLQTIAMPDHEYAAYRRKVDWTQLYVFPGTCIPSLGALRDAMAGRLAIDDVENIGPHYAHTLRAWRGRFLARLDEVRRLGFDERFVRTWDLYLAFAEAAFAERVHMDLQLLLTRRRPGS